MILLIGGETHSGKTLVAQTAVAATGFACTSIDHIKMGLIRAGYTDLTPMDSDDELTEYLWPVVREMVKTAIENDQDLILEGCYIPATWRRDFPDAYLAHIATIFLVMSEDYIQANFQRIVDHAHVVENRKDDSWLTKEALVRDNRRLRDRLEAAGEPFVLIDQEYPDPKALLEQLLA